uniref:Uncharacterized protein n=1 Tax=Arundo donax TaxID=35708 RepID=A0A0A9HDD8_ARUDO
MHCSNPCSIHKKLQRRKFACISSNRSRSIETQEPRTKKVGCSGDK